MWPSSAWNSGARLVACALVLCAAFPWPARAQEFSRDDPQPRELEGPPKGNGLAGEVLLLPTRGRGDGPVGKDAVDVLLRSALEDLELRTIPSSARTKACGKGKGELIAARAAYLDLDLVEALAAADRAREALRSAEAVLWACSELDSVELFLAQVHLDRQNERGAREMMASVLARGAVMAPDPARYTPDFQALWEQLARGGVGTQGPPLDTKAMERLGASVGSKWVVLASLDGPDGAGERLSLAVVSSAGRVDKSGVAQLVLGATGGWGATVRKALTQFFPTRALQMRPERGIRETDEAMATAKKPIFRRWWFWTVVGVVVVGGAAAAIAAAVVSDEPSPTKVTVDLNQ